MSEDVRKTRQAYVERVTRGEGFMPWQEHEHVSPAETEFRDRMERRKDEMLSRRTDVAHPVLITNEQIDRARRNVADTRWGEVWFADLKRVADHVAGQPDGYVQRMIPELTPTNPYGLTCPNCVGVSSQEGLAYRSIRWDYRDPDIVRCVACGQTYPDPEFPETIRLVCPRRRQTFTYCASEAERTHPEDRSGTHAWKWVGKPVHSSFTGYVRAMKVGFMTSAAGRLSLCYRLTGEARYARAATRILLRFTECYPNWLYHDFYDTIADCDPLYAAWNFMELKLEYKRHLCGMAYGDSRYETGPVDDTFDCAKMLATYFGSGRIHPSVDSISSRLGEICRAYDGIHDAADSDGSPLLNEQIRGRIEKALILEYLLTAERFVGGTGDPPDLGNKSPSVYQAQAIVGKCLGLPGYVDAALRGYEGLRDR
ncbi:MAG: hypothetical protein QGI83_07375, partial [Candidatus Latescibacteria bacterium]|nr:hypothetical protein [Candidatus Latescibacterota bacterium]